MAQTHFALSWPSYQSNVCASFSAFQQNGEMVDMTLAADGHIVKVHQILMALSSPYLKELICSAPCQHPVIFLNNVSNQILTSLLEYIYSGEVLVPMKDFPAFVQTAKQLKIKGLENVTQFVSPTKPAAKTKVAVAKDQPRTISITRSNEDSQVYQVMSTTSNNEIATNKMISDEQQDYDTSMVEDQDYDDDDDAREMTYEDLGQTVETATLNHNTLQYTVSNRGSLQAIVNRYIYNHTSDSKKSGEKKWRCSEYRAKKCNAIITTKGDSVSKRVNPHNHGFHDKKILDKIARKLVYSTIEQLHCEKVTAESTEDDDWKI